MRRYLDGGFQQTYGAAAPALGLRFGLEIQERAVLQDEIALLPAVQEVGPLVQVALQLNAGAVLRVLLVVLVDLRYRTLGHRTPLHTRARRPTSRPADWPIVTRKS